MVNDFVINTIKRDKLREYCKCTHRRQVHGNYKLGCLECTCSAFDLSSMSDSTDKEILDAISVKSI